MDAEDKIQSWIDGLEQFDLWQSVCDFYKENEQELVEMNKAQMRNKMMPDGQPILVPGAVNPYDLYRTGAFYSGLHIETTDEQIIFTSSDPKWLGEVPPQPNFIMSMTPLLDWFGMVLGIPTDKEEEVDNRRNTSVSGAFRAIFD